MDRDTTDSATTTTTPARSATSSPLQILPHQARQSNSGPQLIQDLLTHDPMPALHTEERHRDYLPHQQQPQPEPSNTAASRQQQSNTQRHACEPCRVAKAKCELMAAASSEASGPCKRCAKTDRDCVFAERSKTRRRKRRESTSSGLGGTDQRVEELERKLENLVAVGIAKGINGFEEIANNGQANGSNTRLRGTTDQGRFLDQRSRIEDVLNSPLRGSDERDLYTGPPLHKRSRVGSIGSALPSYQRHTAKVHPPGCITNVNEMTRNTSTTNAITATTSGQQQVFEQPCMSMSKDRKAYSPVPLSITHQLQNQFQQSPTQPPYDPARPLQELAARPRMSSSTTYKDVIDQGFISLSLATLLYNHFTVELLPHTPFIALPPFFTTSACRETRPALFLAILVGTLQRPPPALLEPLGQINGNALIDELHWIIAERVMYRGEKSLEMVQALLVSCSWYTTPTESVNEHANVATLMEKHKAFMWLSLAIAMVHDLGLARPGTGARCSLPERKSPRPTLQHNSPEETEGRRAALGCYWLSVNISMVMHRPQVMRWSGSLSDSLEFLQRGNENDGRGISHTDKILVEMVKAAQIVGECGFGGTHENMYEAVGSSSMKVARLKFIISSLEKQVEDWWKNIPENLRPHTSISLVYYGLQLYIYEICLHSEQHSGSGSDSVTCPPFLNDTVFKRKFGKLFGWTTQSPSSPLLTAAYIPVIIKSAHNLLDNFLGFGKGTIDFLPHLSFGRVCHAILVLVKVERIFNSGNLSDIKVPIDNLLEELKIGWYVERIMAVMGRTKGLCAGHKGWMMKLFQSIKNWWDRQLKLAECSVCETESGKIGGQLCGYGNTPTPMADPGLSGTYLTPSSSVSEPASGQLGSIPGFTPVNATTGYPNSQDQISPPGSVLGGSAGMGFSDDTFSMGTWDFTNEDFVALVNAGSGLHLFEF